MKKYTDNDKKEEKLIDKVKSSAKVAKGNAIAILKSKDILKQAKGKKGLLVKKKSR